MITGVSLPAGARVAPDFSLLLQDNDITQNIRKRLISLSLTDNRGFEADQLDIELDDSDGLMAMPQRHAMLSLALGWAEVIGARDIVIGVNALGVAPTGATPAFYKGKGMRFPPEHGPLAAVTPGTPGGLMAMVAEYGRLSLADVLAPAISLADGYALEDQLANPIEREKKRLAEWPATAKVFLPHRGGAGDVTDEVRAFWERQLQAFADVAREDAARAERMTTQLASLMRSSLDQRSTPLVPLAQEIQNVRDYLETLDWDKTPPAPKLPPEVIARTSQKYREALERLTGRKLA